MYSTKKTSLKFLRRTALYLKEGAADLFLFKKSGYTLDEAGIDIDNLPGRLYVLPKDKLQALQEIQQGLTQQLQAGIESGDLGEVKDAMTELMEETLTEPRSGSLENLSPMVSILIREYSNSSEVLRNLALMAFADYTTAMHSVNVMALTLGFCLYHKEAIARSHSLGLAALLHDVGKTTVPIELLTAPRKLTDEEFAIIRAHTTKGGVILAKCKFIDRMPILAATQHHEKNDGSGYPKGIQDISYVGHLVGIVDCYEALTADERPYREALDPFKALKTLYEDVTKNKFDKKIFKKFVKYIGR